MKKLLFIALSALVLVSCKQVAPADALLSRMQKLADGAPVYGHQDDSFYGVSGYWEQGRSDTYALLGDYPGVMGFDLGGLEEHHDKNLDSVPFTWIREEAVKHVERGGIVTFSWHPRNPRTGHNAWDTSDASVVANVLEGGEQHELFMGWLDDVTSFLQTLKLHDGSPMPFIFRPWHEYNGSWFWWGQALCSDEEYVALYKMTQDYISAALPTSIVWAQSPNLYGGWTEETFTKRFVGADRIQLLGQDCYQWGSEEAFIEQNTADVAFLSDFAKRNGMLFAITECGRQNSPCADWWSRVFMPTIEGSNAIYFLPWRNWHEEHFGVAPETTTAEDFKQLVADKRVRLLKNIQ